jgi:hypothetical protein
MAAAPLLDGGIVALANPLPIMAVLGGLVASSWAAGAHVLVPGELVTGAGSSLVVVDRTASPAGVTILATLPDFVADVALEPAGTLAVATWNETTLAIGIHRVDPATGSVTLVRSLSGEYPSVAVEANGRLLVNLRTVVLRLDPLSGATLAQAATICLGGPPSWVPRGSGIVVDAAGQVFAVVGCPELLQIDLATGSAVSAGVAFYTPFTDVAVGSGSDSWAASAGLANFFGVTVQGPGTPVPYVFLPSTVGEAFLAYDPARSEAVLNLGIDDGSAPPHPRLVPIDLATSTLGATIVDSVAGAAQTAGLAIVLPVCSDRLDNDGDGVADHPADAGCADAGDDDERAAPLLGLAFDGRLLAIDVQTGAGTVLGATGLAAASALERAEDGRLFAVAGGNQLHRIDPDSYAPALVGPLAPYPFVSALAFVRGDTALYAAASADPDGRAERLIRVDPDTGATTERGVFGAGFTDVQGLAFAPSSGRLYAVEPPDCSSGTHCIPGAVGRVDPATGAIVSAVDVAASLFAADFDETDRLWITAFALGGGPAQLARLDEATGAATVAGMIGFDTVTGLATVHPGADPTPDCADGFDNDGDGRTDYAGQDPGCSDADDVSEKAPAMACDDGAENDGDGLTDFRVAGGDPGCRDPLSKREDPACDDDVDNDLDGRIDADGPGTPDPNCTAPWRDTEGGCGLGVELVLLLLALARRTRRRRQRASDSTAPAPRRAPASGSGSSVASQGRPKRATSIAPSAATIAAPET